MHRRPARLLTAALLALGIVLPTSVVAAAPAAAEVTVLAAESFAPGEAPGLEPMDPDDEANEFAPTNYEANFLWGAAVGLLFLVLAVLGGLGAAYWWLVVKPNQVPTRS